MGLKEKKRSVLDFIASDLYVPMKEKEIAILLQVTSDQRELLKEALRELLLERKIQISKRGKYSICETVKMEGVFISNAKGFGFIEVENQEQDFFVPESEVKGAFHKDLVAFELLEGKTGKRQEARVISVLSHTITQIVGTFEKSQNFGFVIPDDSKIAHDIFIPKELTKRAVNGSKVVIELTNYGHKGKKPEGRVIEILGHINDPGVDIMSIIKGFEIPCEFPEKVMNQAINVAKDVSEADRSGRRDLRNVLMVTIDGEDAKDLDDAVSLDRKSVV